MEEYRGKPIILVIKNSFCCNQINVLILKISDDEDETHPNIDTPSLFRWRHQARIERMEEQKKEMESFEKKKSDRSINKVY